MNSRLRHHDRPAYTGAVAKASAEAVVASHPLYLAEPLEPRVLLAIAPAAGEFRVNANTDLPTAPLGPEFQVSTDRNNTLLPFQSVAMDANGNFVVAWRSVSIPGAVHARRYNAIGQPLGDAFLVGSAETTVAVAMAPGGDFVVAWSNSGVRARRYNAAGQPLGGEFRVNTRTIGTQWLPSVAIDADGDFVIAWVSHGAEAGGSSAVYAQRYGAAGETLGGEFRVGSTPTWGQWAPSVATDSDGDFVVAWTTAPNQATGHQVYARRYDSSGQPLGDEFRANTAGTGEQWLQSAAMSADGAFVITWESNQQDGSGYGIYAQRYAADGRPVSGEFRVNTLTTDSQRYPSVAMDAQGDFVIAWDSYADQNVHAQRYGAAGQPLGEEFIVNMTQGPGDAYPAAAMDADGDFVITWEGGGIRGRTSRQLTNPASVGGRVWDDLNYNGLREANETGIDGVTVQLFRESGPSVGTAVTTGGGQYRFDGLLPGDRFYLQFVAPAGSLFVPANQGDDDSRDSDADPQTGRTPLFTPAPDQVDLSRDVGLTALASLAGVKFNDRDRDGRRDLGEEGLPGWIIYVDADTDGRLDPTESSTTTDPTGSYRFDRLLPGAYRVAEVAQPGWLRTAPAKGFHTVVLGAGQNATAIDFAAHPGLAGPEFRANRTTAADQQAPAVAMNDDGEFVVAWESFQQDGSGWGVYAQRYDRRGKPRGSEFRVNTTTAGDQRDPAVAMDDKGDFVVTWEHAAPDGTAAVHARRFHHNGMPRGGEFRVATAAADPAIAADAVGDLVIAWERPGPGGASEGVYARRYDRATRPRGDAFPVATPDISPAAPAVAMDSDGDFVVAWRHGPLDNIDSEILARRYSAAGVPRGDAFAVTTPDYLVRSAPSVAIDADGDFAIAWSEHSPYYYSYYPYYHQVVDTVSVRRYNAAGLAREADFLVGYGVDPAVAMDAAGDLAIAWQEGPSNPRHAYGPPPAELLVRRYNALAQPQGWSRVNTTTAGDQRSPAVAMDRHGDFVVAWQSSPPDGSGTGIYAQRYAAIPARPPVPPVRPKKPTINARTVLDLLRRRSLDDLAETPDLLAGVPTQRLR